MTKLGNKIEDNKLKDVLYSIDWQSKRVLDANAVLRFDLELVNDNGGSYVKKLAIDKYDLYDYFDNVLGEYFRGILVDEQGYSVIELEEQENFIRTLVGDYDEFSGMILNEKSGWFDYLDKFDLVNLVWSQIDTRLGYTLIGGDLVD